MTTVTEVRRRRVAKRPPALPTIALSLLLSPNGPLNAGLKAGGLGSLAKMWLTPDLIFKVILVGLVWVSVGYYLTLMMSAIGRIPTYYYEAAELDGAGRVSTFFNVTLPLSWDVVTVSVVLLGMVGRPRSRSWPPAATARERWKR